MITPRKLRIIGCAGIALFPIALLLYVLWSQVFIHDWYLWRFAQSYATIQHPSTSRHLKTYKELGLLVANGNHIDLFVGELRSYSGPRQQILNWYAGKTIPSQLERSECDPVEVVFIDHGTISSGTPSFDRPYPFDDISKDLKTIAPPGTNLYVVYVLDAWGYDPGIDIRGM